ncbi:MAG: HNH endonuclease [Spirochaetes bacterium]|nr:MAG: HNH endonuclease [Spirochaetota bacterium]
MEAKDLKVAPDQLEYLRYRLAIAVPDRPEGQCWVPILTNRTNGYVRMAFIGLTTGVHRWMWLLEYGECPPVLDHAVCDNPECCNPAHLTPATHQENILRGTAPTAANAKKSHCKRGHPFDEENTYICTNKDGSVRRICRACNNKLTLRRYHERRGH